MSSAVEHAVRPVGPLVVEVAVPDGRFRRGRYRSGRLVVGRDPSCDLVLPSQAVSRRHAVVEWDENGLIVSDRSANGTLVDGEPLTDGRRRCGSRSELRIGAYSLSLRLEALEAEGPNGPASSPAKPLPVERADEARGTEGVQSARASAPDSDSGDPDAAVNNSGAAAPAALRRRIHRRLLEALDLAQMDPNALDVTALRPRVLDALERLIAEASEDLPEGLDREQLARELADEALGLGPLEPLINDSAVSEIMVVDPSTIFVERSGCIEQTRTHFTDAESVRAVIERIVTPLGRRIDESTPLVDARLRDGSRVNAVIPPLAVKGPCITIRKFPTERLTFERLTEFGSFSDEMRRFLEAAVRIRKNIVISGGTGSGKTTLLNVLSSAIPRRERIVTIEDAAELSLGQPHVVSLESRPPNMEGKGEYSIRDLVKNALRMRPDRIVVGECRSGEAVDMLQAMNTGHEGSMTTTHANSPREAVARLETLCLMAGIELPISAIRSQIASSVHLIVQQSRFPDGSRRVVSIAEVGAVGDRGEVELRDIYRYERLSTGADGTVKGEFRATGFMPSFVDELMVHGIELWGGGS